MNIPLIPLSKHLKKFRLMTNNIVQIFALIDMGSGFFGKTFFFTLTANFHDNSRPIDHNHGWTNNAHWSCFL